MTDHTALALTARDRLLLAGAELGLYGVAVGEAVDAPPAVARAELAERLRRRSPHGLGSYAFWVAADDALLDAGGELPLHTSGPEVDRAVAAACAHHGLAVRPGPRGTLFVR
jgi:hypothetical protein